jgi:hypothetical protein
VAEVQPHLAEFVAPAFEVTLVDLDTLVSELDREAHAV